MLRKQQNPISQIPDLLEFAHAAFLISFMVSRLFLDKSSDCEKLCTELHSFTQSVSPLDDEAAYRIHLSKHKMLQERLYHTIMELDVPTLGSLNDEDVNGAALWTKNLNSAL